MFLEYTRIDAVRLQVLRFVSEFVELFDVEPTKTRIAFIQYSEQIRPEFDFGTHQTKAQVEQVITVLMRCVLVNV